MAALLSSTLLILYNYILFFIFLIDCPFSVRPKKKVFQNSEERRNYVQNYRRKIKTELCKTWLMTGSCAYGKTVTTYLKTCLIFYPL